MIPRKFQFQTFSFFMSLLMSGVMSLVTLALELPAIADLITQWPKAWGVSMLVAFPVSLILVPVVRRLVARINGDELIIDINK